MKISIVIPVYNAEKTIRYCIDSILNQRTEFEIEIIMVEDYSTDKSFEICLELEAQHTEIRLYRTNGKGVSAARNTGLLHTTGDVIGFCDADDIYEQKVFESIRPFFERRECDLVVGGFYYSKINELKAVVQETHSHKQEKRVEGFSLYNMILNDNRVLGSVCNKFYRAESIKNASFPIELEYCEDLVFNAILVAKYNLKAVIVGYPIYHYIINDESATNNIDRLFTEDSRLKYIVSLEKLLTEVADRKCKIYTEYKIETLALDFLYHKIAEGNRRNELIEIIHKYKRGFFKGMAINIQCGSLKWIIKGIIVWISKWEG